MFGVIVVTAAAFGVDRVYAWTGTPERHFGALTWLLCGLAFIVGQQVAGAGPTTPSTFELPKVVGGGAVLAAGIVGLWATAEVLGWHPMRLVGAGDRPVGPFGSSAYLGAAAVLLAPVAMGVALDAGWSRECALRPRRPRDVHCRAGGVGGPRRLGCRGGAARARRTQVGQMVPRGSGPRDSVGLAFGTGVAGRLPTW